MRNNQEKIDDDQFAVFLSRGDYEQLKRYRNDYQQLKSQLEVKTDRFESQKNAILQRYQSVVSEVKDLAKEKKEAQQLLNRLDQSLKERHSTMTQKYQIELSTHNDKRPANTKTLAAQQQLSSKLIVSMHLTDQLLNNMGVVLSKQSERVSHLVREIVGLKEQNFRLREEARQKNQRLNASEEQRQKAQESLERSRLQIEQFKREANRLQQVYILESSAHNSLKAEHKQYQQHSMEKLTGLYKQLKEVKKQIELTQQQNIQFQKQNTDLQDEIKQYQQHISILKQSMELSSRQKEARKTKNPKYDKEDSIKQNLVEYMRQIRKNLISIGNLSQEEIKQIGTSELRTLIKFIQELQEDFE